MTSAQYVPRTKFRSGLPYGCTQSTIVIDSNFHPRLTDYRLTAIVSGPNVVDPGSATSPSVGTVRYMAPELLSPPAFGLEINNNPTKKSDIYAFGMITYQVSITYSISNVAIDGDVQVVTGEQPFSGVKDDAVVDKVVEGLRPSRPPDPNEWVSNDVWNFVSSCWSSSWDGRPDICFAMNALNNAAGTVEARRRKLSAPNGRGKRASSGASHLYQSRTQVKLS